MKFIDVFYQSDDGLRLYARDYAGVGPNSPVVLCLPGLTRNSKDFNELAERLCQRYRVICPDLRGRGRSQRDTDATRYRPDRYVADMICLLDTLGVKQLTVIGTSLGGMMGILLMAAHPQRVCALVINDMGPVIDPVGIARIINYVGKTAPVENWDDAVAQTALVNGIAFPAYGRAEWEAMARKLYVWEGQRPIFDYDASISSGLGSGTATPDLWPLFDMLPPHPILVVRGEISDILSVATMAQMQRRRPNLQTVTVSGVGHAPMLDEPEAITAIERFLGGLESP